MKAEENDIEQLTDMVTLTISLETGTLMKIMKAIKANEPAIFEDFKDELIRSLEKLSEETGSDLTLKE